MADEFDSTPAPAELLTKLEAEAHRTGTTVAEAASVHVRGMLPQSQAAAEALERWRKGVRDDPMMTPGNAAFDAAVVIEIARVEHIPLGKLIPDQQELLKLLSDAEDADGGLGDEHDLEDPRAV